MNENPHSFEFTRFDRRHAARQHDGGGRRQSLLRQGMAWLLVVSFALPTAAAAGPREVVQQVIDSGLSTLKNAGLTREHRRAELQQMVERYFDFTTLSRLVLARNWRKLSDQQKTTFVSVFKTHLARTYGKNIEDYDNEQAVITGDKEEARGDWTVMTKVLRPGADAILVKYRLRRSDDAWMMIDVVVEGVSLVSNWRAQFKEVLGNKSIDQLIEMLREKSDSWD